MCLCWYLEPVGTVGEQLKQRGHSSQGKASAGLGLCHTWAATRGQPSLRPKASTRPTLQMGPICQGETTEASVGTFPTPHYIPSAQPAVLKCSFKCSSSLLLQDAYGSLCFKQFHQWLDTMAVDQKKLR